MVILWHHDPCILGFSLAIGKVVLLLLSRYCMIRLTIQSLIVWTLGSRDRSHLMRGGSIHVKNVAATLFSWPVQPFSHVDIVAARYFIDMVVMLLGKILLIKVSCITDNRVSLSTIHSGIILNDAISFTIRPLIMETNTSFNIYNSIIDIILIDEITWLIHILIIYRLAAKLTITFSKTILGSLHRTSHLRIIIFHELGASVYFSLYWLIYPLFLLLLLIFIVQSRICINPLIRFFIYEAQLIPLMT